MSNKLRAAIAADSPLTAGAGARIAELGGNVVDIAVAAALTATVSEMLMCSLAGSAFCMIRMPGKAPELIEGADAIPTIPEAPFNQSEAWRLVHIPYGDGIDVMAGHASVAVPGMLAAVETAWKRHGTLPWPEIVQPALELARIGCPVEPTCARWLRMSGESLYFQQPASRECFFRNGQPLQDGDIAQIPGLEQTFQAIAEEGARALYQGDLAAAFVKEMQENGGFITREDLASYRAAVRTPLVLNSAGFELVLNPPPAVGGAALGVLVKLLEQNWRDDASPEDRALLQARVQRHLLELRESKLSGVLLEAGDAQRLLSEDLLRGKLSALASPSTTHFSVVTGDGGMVAMTMSSGYGSGINIPGTGIACNNSLGEPELNPQGFHAGKPGSRLISNTAPTLAWNQQGNQLAFGSPGASRITTAIAQFWANYALGGQHPQEAILAPRLHVEPLEESLRVQCEPGIATELLAREFSVRQFPERDMYFGAVKLAALYKSGELLAFADDRRYGGVKIV